MTRILAIVGALSAATLLGGWTWGFDRQGPFCLYDRDYTNCGYPSFAACLATPAARAAIAPKIHASCPIAARPGGEGLDKAGVPYFTPTPAFAALHNPR